MQGTGQREDGAIAISLSGLSYEVDGTRLLEDVNVEAHRGEFIGLVGPNGAGKSTLLKCAAGLLRSSAGVVSVDGRTIDEITPGRLARMLAYVPQTPPNTFGFTGLEVVMMGRYARMGRFAVEGDADRKKVLDSMRRTETHGFADRIVSTLSGGERQRVIVARALAQETQLLLLDEPTASLDVQHQLKVFGLVKELVSEGMTVVAAIHDLPMAARFCNRLVMLNNGRVICEGTPEQVLTAANIETAFGVRSVTYPDPLTGTLTVSLLDPAKAGQAIGKGARVHLVCGGGSGARAMYELQRAGFTVTACVLGAGDTDRRAADILGVNYVPTPAFGAIDDAADASHRALIVQADYVVLCETPFGLNNLRNLEAVKDCASIIFLETQPVDGKDFTGGKATRIHEGMSPLAKCDSLEGLVPVLEGLMKMRKST